MFRRWAPLLAVAVLLAAAWAAAVLSSPELNNIPVPPLQADVPSATETPPDDEEVDDSPSPQPQTEVELPDERSGLISIVGLGVAVTLGGAVTWFLVRRRARNAGGNPLVVQRPARRAATAAEEVVAAIDAGITELSASDADPRRAVIACWVRLEQAAAAAGTPRRASDSPTDLVTRLLHAHRVSPAVLDGFAAVYREARYATHRIDEPMRRAAVAALRQVRSELHVEVAEAGVGAGTRGDGSGS